MGVRGGELYRSMAVVAIVLSMVLCVILAAVPAASAADTPTVTVLRENFENPKFNCSNGWDQDNKEMWVRGDNNPDSGVDTWCHSQYRVSPSGNSWSLWCAVIGTNSIAADRGLGSQANTASQRYDANMTSYIRHSLNMDPTLGTGTLTFIYWSMTMASSAPGGYDHLSVSVSSDDATYTTIWTQPSANEGSWKQVTATVPADAKTISFDFISGPYTSGTEWQEGAYIDNILVTQASDPSWSHVSPLPSYSPASFDIDVGVNTAQGVPESVKLYYRTEGTGSYTLYTDHDHADGAFSSGEVIHFNSSLTGGELDYQFYSIASGGGVTEPQPPAPDAATSVDAESPVMTASLNRTAGEGGWYNGSVTVQLTAEDQRSGVANIQYKLDNGNWRDWNGDLTIAGDGAHVLSYQAVDRVGNIAPVMSQAIKIDTTAPFTFYTVNENGNVSLFPTDAASGVESAYFRDSGGEWTKYDSQAQILPADGILEYYAIDRAGHIEEVRSLDLHNVPMSKVTLNLADVKATYPRGEAVRLAWSIEDPAGMVDHFDILVDGVVVKTMDRAATSVDLEGLSDGGHFILVRAADAGGNSTYREVAITIGSGGDDASSTLSLIAVGAVVVVGAVVGALFFRPKRSK